MRHFVIVYAFVDVFNSNFLIKLALYEVIKYTGVLENKTHFLQTVSFERLCKEYKYDVVVLCQCALLGFVFVQIAFIYTCTTEKSLTLLLCKVVARGV